MPCNAFQNQLTRKHRHLQAALDRMEDAKPSTSQLAQPGQIAHEAPNSDNMAGTSKRKDKKRQQQQPVTQLLEDQALNAELDAANTGGMVETERDRLIRIVSAQNSVYYPVANQPGIFCHKQLSLGATDLHHASHVIKIGTLLTILCARTFFECHYKPCWTQLVHCWPAH